MEDIKLMPLEGENGGKVGDDLLDEIVGTKSKKNRPGAGGNPQPGTNWDALSKVEETADQQTMATQVMKFKADMVKDEGLYENVMLALKDASMEQKAKKDLVKSTKGLQNSLQEQNGEASEIIKHAKFTVENVKRLLEGALIVLQKVRKHRVSTYTSTSRRW